MTKEMIDEQTYSLHVHPGAFSEECASQTVQATKRTTAAEVIALVAARLCLDDEKSFVLVELHNSKGEEMVLAQSDHPVERMLLWPLQFQHCYKFMLRQTDKDGTVLYKGATTWQAKLDEDSTQRYMAQKGFLPPSEPSKEDYPDLCALSELSQDKILEVLKMRFMKDKIYTYTANMLISINPYKFLPIYNPKYMTIYQNRKKEELAPHIYAIADTAFTNMVESKQNQCIVITGKSGSGKTQSTHYLVHHTLALCQKSYMTGLEHMLIGCGPVLEAFGNAQTEHNNNSSRFGKFLRIYFYDTGLLSGADIQTYLLEKSRLIHQEPNERNFHIFYYLLCGASDEELKELHLDRDMTFEYVKKSNMLSEHEASSELNRLRQAMEVIGFFKGAQKNIFKLIAAILLLGNITFRIKKGRDESLEIEDESFLLKVCSLLSLDPSHVRKCLLTRKAKAGAGERFVLDLKLNEAVAARDAMAKALYQYLFEWTVSSINMALAQRTRDNKLRSQSRWVGLLDIFGFEDFVKNGFEQFCINYASEHLQHYCIKHTFHIEQEAYKQEGLTWKEIEFADNSGCINLYEKKPLGLFFLLEENFPGASNQTLLSQFNRVHKDNPYFESPVVKEDAFIILHYAGKVKYQIKDFREKNHDQVREDIITVFRSTRSGFIQELISKSPASLFRWSILRAVFRALFAFKSAPHAAKGKEKLARHMWSLDEIDGKHVQAAYVHKKMMTRISYQRSASIGVDYFSRYEGSGGSYHGKKKTTVNRTRKKIISISQQYQASLAALLSALEKASPYFVRCIQPNNEKVPLKIDDKLVLHQLRCSGTLQTILLEQSRYPERFSTDLFLERYKLLFPKNKRVITLDEIRSYLLSIDLKPRIHFQLGQTQVFLRVAAFQALSDQLHRVVQQHVVFIQTRIRGWITRKFFLLQRDAAIRIQSFWRMIECQKMIDEWNHYATVIQVAWRFHKTRKLLSWLIPLQAQCRAHLTKSMFKQKREQLNRSATIVQRSWTRYKEGRSRVVAAIRIQACFRGYSARKAYQSDLRDHRARVLEDHEPEKSSVTQRRVESASKDDVHSPIRAAGLENDLSPTNTCSSEKSTFEKPPDTPISIFKKPTLSDLTSELNFIDDDDVTVASTSPSDVNHKDDAPAVTSQKPDKSNQINDIKERRTVPPDTTTGKGLYNGQMKKSQIDHTPPGDTNNTRTDHIRLNTRTSGPYGSCKAGDYFVKSALGNDADRESILPRTARLDSREDQLVLSDSDAGDIIPSPTSSSRDSLDEKPLPPRSLFPDSKGLSQKFLSSSKGTRASLSYPMLPQANVEPTFNHYSQRSTGSGYETQSTKETHFPALRDPGVPSSSYTETTFSADDRSVTAEMRSKSSDFKLLEKEWLAFQKVEHERQIRERDKRMTERPLRETKQERKIREEIMNLRLKQMSSLKEKMDSFGLTADAMPEFSSLSRRASQKTEPGTPTSPLTPSAVSSIPEHKEVTESIKPHSLPRSSSLESITRSLSNKKPRRQRSNSAVEMYVDMRTPSSDPIARKSNSLSSVNAAAFAKKCRDDETVLEKLDDESNSMEKLDTSITQADNKRTSALFGVVKKKLLTSHRSNPNKPHPPLVSRKSTDSLASIGTMHSISNEKTSTPEEPPVEVRVRSTEAEKYSPKLLISKPDELMLLETFIKDKVKGFSCTNKVDQVFKAALTEFCNNLFAMFAITLSSGSTNGLRYKDIVTNFQKVLEKKAKDFSLDQYAAIMVVNGFQGYMSEYMKDILPKHVHKESKTKTKRKKVKDDALERLGHRFFHVQWGINQICEVCGATMWLMESGVTCKICKFACHKKCVSKITSKCSDASSIDKMKNKPRKLFGESLSSLEAKESLVPVFVDKCISYMEANGIYQEGVYRRSAAATQVKQLVDALNKDYECQKINFDDYNIHVVAACFKKFLRSLPEPLVSRDKYFEFLQASKLNNEHEKIASLFNVLDGIPEHNHATLERIAFHLARVAQQDDTNLMSPSNLAIVFTPCFFSPPPHVSPVSAAEHIGSMTRGIEIIIAEQVKKIRKTLENISELDHVESSTNEKLIEIRKSMGKGKKRRIRPSFREGPRSPTTRRALVERQTSLGAVEEESVLAKEEQKYEQQMASLKSRKESLTSRLLVLSPQFTVDLPSASTGEEVNNPYLVTNEHLRHLNKHRVSSLPKRRRPSRFAASIYSSTPPPTDSKEEVKPSRKVSQRKSRFKRLSSSNQNVDSFKRASQLRNPIHPPRRKKGPKFMKSSPFFGKDMKLGRTKGTAM